MWLGVDFDKHLREGIDVEEFGGLMMVSGMNKKPTKKQKRPNYTGRVRRVDDLRYSFDIGLRYASIGRSLLPLCKVSFASIVGPF